MAAVSLSSSDPMVIQAREEISDLQTIRELLPYDVPLALIIANCVPRIFDYIRETFSTRQHKPMPGSIKYLLPNLTASRFLAQALLARKRDDDRKIVFLAKVLLNEKCIPSELEQQKGVDAIIEGVLSAFRLCPKISSVSLPVLQFQLYIAIRLGNVEVFLKLFNFLCQLKERNILDPSSLQKARDVLHGKYQFTETSIDAIVSGFATQTFISTPGSQEVFKDEYGQVVSIEEILRYNPTISQLSDGLKFVSPFSRPLASEDLKKEAAAIVKIAAILDALSPSVLKPLFERLIRNGALWNAVKDIQPGIGVKLARVYYALPPPLQAPNGFGINSL